MVFVAFLLFEKWWEKFVFFSPTCNHKAQLFNLQFFSPFKRILFGSVPRPLNIPFVDKNETLALSCQTTIGTWIPSLRGHLLLSSYVPYSRRWYLP
jgi:hypothetical protein